MLILFVILYFALTVSIGFYANKKVSGGRDFINAGRNLHPVLNAFALFALWFGSETLFGSSSEFLNHGILGIIEDPFGGVLCLLLVGFFYAKKMYRLNVLTIGDLFEINFGQKIEILASFMMVVSFLGYIAAQLLALGLILKVLLGVSLALGVILSAVIVITYTITGGMLAVTLTDFIQSIMIIIGLIFISIFLYKQTNGLPEILSNIPESHLRFFPEKGMTNSINWIASWMVLGLGSIVSQDVFQRVNSARNEKSAYISTIAGALMYFIFAMIPLFLIICIKTLYPQFMTQGDAQTILPTIVLTKMPMLLQILFFGSVLSAILSTCSGAILAPASLVSENILRPLFFQNESEDRLLFNTRVSIIFLTAISIIIALSSDTIFELVGQSSAFGLVSIFVPFTAALFFDYKNKSGAIFSMVAGSIVWAICKFYLATEIEPLIYGLIASIMGLYLGHILFIKKVLFQPLP
ncbi:MAG: hypothetical protein RLZZ546_3099 [Bacteroidota bacterium]|jgi:SSS family transporter